MICYHVLGRRPATLRISLDGSYRLNLSPNRQPKFLDERCLSMLNLPYRPVGREPVYFFHSPPLAS